MQLLHTDTLTLKFFPGKEKPRYAILSHTWGKDEILFQDVGPGWVARLSEDSSPGQRREGLAKVVNSCRIARSQSFHWIWIDTCCIDKSSSVELSESINSMFRWYAESDICYAYLSDVHGSHLDSSRWFNRGWTLQELIAPPDVEFFNASWNHVGYRNSLALHIAEISGIDQSILRHGHHRRCACATTPGHTSRPCNCAHGHSSHVQQYGYNLATLLPRFSVATKMSWASKRQTSREEDIAYCLLGLFNVNLLLISGEGKAAFSRLLKEIAQSSNDQSMLAWQVATGAPDMDTWYPSSPAYFPFNFIHNNTGQKESSFTTVATSLGMEVNMLLCPILDPVEHSDSGMRVEGRRKNYLGILDCTINGNALARPAIWLKRLGDNQDIYERAYEDTVYVVLAREQGERLGRVEAWATLELDDIYEDEINLIEASRQNTLVRGCFGGQERITRAVPAREIRIVIPTTYGYSVTHCVPDFRTDPYTGDLIVTLTPYDECDNIIFLESPSGPRFLIAWTPAWCAVNDIDDVRAIISARLGEQDVPMPAGGDILWEMAKDMTQSGAKSFFSARIFWHQHKLDNVTRHTATKGGFEMTANLVEKSFLSQRTIELHISVTKPTSR
ncbi:HET-domain-containing protein [Apiospora rasikravindrae]|uniref:HET-domain-containing protein n=1 Tax=Apiospora rasikravindrae TaxID=990691 RepID=A0ABR1U111_9PEZI